MNTKNFQSISRTQTFLLNHSGYLNKRLKLFKKITEWNDESIPPTFPYALLTGLQLSLVLAKEFPFFPFGIIHKKEVIEVFTPLRFGLWKLEVQWTGMKATERGVEITIENSLSIDGIVSWKSTTTAFKKIRNQKNHLKLGQIMHAPLSTAIANRTWNIDRNLAWEYAKASRNFDPIHVVPFIAKLMGHSRSLIHGMWTLSRAVSENFACGQKSITFPLRIEIKFIKPIYIPAKVQFQKSENGFAIVDDQGRTLHAIGNVTN